VLLLIHDVTARLAEGQSFYHCVSRAVDRRFIFQSARQLLVPFSSACRALKSHKRFVL